MNQIDGILIFVICILIFRKIPLPILTYKLQEAERQIDRERDEEIFLKTFE